MKIMTKQNWQQMASACRLEDQPNGVRIWFQAAGLASVISFLITASITIFSAFMIAYAEVMEHFYAVHINLAPYSNWQEIAVNSGVWAGIGFAATALTLRLRTKTQARQQLSFHPLPAGTSEALQFFGVVQEQTSAAANQSFESYAGTENTPTSTFKLVPFSKC